MWLFETYVGIYSAQLKVVLITVLYFRTDHLTVAFYECPEGQELQYPYFGAPNPGIFFCNNDKYMVPTEGFFIKNNTRELFTTFIDQMDQNVVTSHTHSYHRYLRPPQPATTSIQDFFKLYDTDFDKNDFLYVDNSVPLKCVPTCDRRCRPHGRCDVSTNRCVCDEGYEGDTCTVEVSCLSQFPMVGSAISSKEWVDI